LPRRQNVRRDSEEQRQRLVVLIVAGAIGLALASILLGLGYEYLWKPSRPVAQVGSVSIDRRGYWEEARLAITRQIVQNFQLLALFGGNQQFTQQFQGQAPGLDRQAENLRSLPIDDTIVTNWETRQLKEQGAAPFNITVTQDEINQAIVADLGLIFLPPPPADPAAGAETEGEEAAAGAETEAEGTDDPEGAEGEAAADATEPEASPTPEPTATAVPTPAPAEAATQVDQILAEIFRLYEIELLAVGFEPNLTADDFRAALDLQYREQVLNVKIQEALVPEAEFVADETPDRVRARQVLIAVETAEGATQEQIDAAFAAALPDAEAIAAELRDGADFEAVAAESSDDAGSREQGGVLGFFSNDGVAENGATYPPELAEAAFALPIGEISDPIRTIFGWHVIEVTDREVPPVEDQLREARTTALDEWIVEQRDAIDTQRFPEPTPSPTVAPTEAVPTLVPTFLPGPPTPEPTPTLEPTPEPEGEATPTP
jgi:parvulin-like peptidyl-prolyl isomerase